MLQTVHNSEFSRTMDLFKEIDDLSDLFLLEKNTKLSCPEEGYEDLQSKYSSLHENYAKEIENSKKVEKCLIKCLKFYSKLSKKYEVQQQIIRDLEESIKEKVSSLEEAQKNEEKMKGLIQVYRTERTLYAGQTSTQLRKEKEVLLDICCKLISESVRSNSTSSLSNLLLRKFRKDLNDEKIILLKSKSVKLKDELGNANEIGSEFVLKSEFGALKEEFKTEEKYSNDVTKVEVKEPADDTTSNHSDLDRCEMSTEESSFLENESPKEGSDEVSFAETEREASLPLLEAPPLSLEPICTDKDEQNQSDVVNMLTKCDVQEEGNKSTELNCDVGGEKSGRRDASTESQYSEKLEETTSASENCFSVQNKSKPHEPLTEPTKGWTSIFDICDECPNSSHSKAENENGGVATEFFSEVSFISEGKCEDASFANNTTRSNVGLMNNDAEDDSTIPYESEVFRIFREMASMRLLSPIRETNSSPTETRTCTVAPNENKNSDDGNAGPSLKRNLEAEENRWKNKKLKWEEEKPAACLLDSIMSAMSIQNEEFRSKKFSPRESGEGGEVSEGSSCEFSSPRSRALPRRARKEKGNREAVVCHSSGRIRDRQQAMERLVTEELKNFVSSPISCKEDADKNVRHCVSAMTKKSEDVIAKCIVAIVLENVDEAVEIFERPAPPLTKTQHRLIVLLSVFRTLDWESEKISAKILSIISEKLFPDNFFWPDDCVEAAARFYTALCRARNEPKTLWKFCLTAMTEMRQRCPLLVFTVLKTWPDVLHDASTLKNNMLALTIVNIFLHMPKTEGLRNVNQKRKLVALKHLLINFYQFKVEDTIEGYARSVVEGLRRGESGSEKSLVLLSACRDQDWTSKNVVPALKSTLTAWADGALADSVANTTLSVIKQICPMLTQSNSPGPKVKELAVCLSEILTSRKKSHESEVRVVEVLLLLKQYPDVRKTISEWIPKTPISDGLRNEIINASAENILRELKLNRKKEARNFPVKKKQWKKPKGKKKKGKKKKKSEQKSKA